jgi:hypothetical protein
MSIYINMITNGASQTTDRGHPEQIKCRFDKSMEIAYIEMVSLGISFLCSQAGQPR